MPTTRSPPYIKIVRVVFKLGPSFGLGLRNFLDSIMFFFGMKNFSRKSFPENFGDAATSEIENRIKMEIFQKATKFSFRDRKRPMQQTHGNEEKQSFGASGYKLLLWTEEMQHHPILKTETSSS